MGKFKDLTGMHFGRLTVLGIDHKEDVSPNGSIVYWQCQCECGNIRVVRAQSLTSGKTLSCGCLNAALSSKRFTKHGLYGVPVYRAWDAAKQRCYNPNNKRYKNYGGRGITMYSVWVNDFQAFYAYVSKLPHFGEKGYTLDRIDNDGNYEPNNLRWATKKEQNNNTSRNVFVEYQGQRITLTEAAKMCGLKPECLSRRIKRGYTGEKLFKPSQRPVKK